MRTEAFEAAVRYADGKIRANPVKQVVLPAWSDTSHV